MDHQSCVAASLGTEMENKYMETQIDKPVEKNHCEIAIYINLPSKVSGICQYNRGMLRVLTHQFPRILLWSCP